ALRRSAEVSPGTSQSWPAGTGLRHQRGRMPLRELSRVPTALPAGGGDDSLAAAAVQPLARGSPWANLQQWMRVSVKDDRCNLRGRKPADAEEASRRYRLSRIYLPTLVSDH
ncbi:unnamed protein product, partial [Effrenium voratum]